MQDMVGAVVAVSALDKAQKLILEYEQTRDPSLLEELRKQKALCQMAVRALSALRERKSPAIEEHHMAMAYRILGGISLCLREYSEAWDVYEAARKMAEETNNIEELAGATNNLGQVAFEQGDYDVALGLFREAEQHLTRLQKESSLHEYVRNNIRVAEAKLRSRG